MGLAKHLAAGFSGLQSRFGPLAPLPRCSSKRTEADFQAPRPPRSPDRTRSPVAVSQKREYFKYPPETIGDFAPAAANLGARRPIANSQKPTIGGAFLRLQRVKSPGAGLVGWRRSADRTRLQANSLLTGNFTGKIAISGLKELIW